VSDEEDFPAPIPGNFPPPLEHGLTPMEIASDEPLKAAERFFQALAADDARGLWNCFGDQARAFVLNLGLERGMDFDLNSRLRQGATTDEEFDEFIGDFLQGVRRDLRGVDIQRLAFESQVEPETTMRVRVTYLATLGDPDVGIVTAVPAGSLIMVLEHGDWKIERIIPHPGGSSGAGGAPLRGNGHRS